MARRRKKIEEQMDIFEEGGLKDEGGTVDPVSGNDVPSGSTQSEVRDDIPAQLSEGEFVFPADVVRYIGLENLMELRQKAKMGLQKMEDMGQMGNSEEAIIDDDMQFDGEIDSFIEEMDMEETQNFAIGGMPQAGNPLTSSQVTPVATQPITLPGFSSFVQQPAMKQVQGLQPAVESKEFIGPNGERVTIQFVNGQPATPVPDGYREMTAQEKEEAMKPKIEQPEVQKESGREEREEPSTEPNFGFGAYRSMEEMTDIFSTVNEDLNNLKATQKTRKQTPFMAVELFNKVVNGIKEGYYTNQAVDQVRSGENLTKSPVGDYASWRQNMSKPMAAATLETENEAKEISRGDRDIQGSSFASRNEANAVANSGWGSDDHFNAIEDSFSNNRGSTVGDAGLADASAGVTGDPAGRSMGPSYSGPAEADQVGGDDVSEGGPESGNTEGSSFSKGGAVKPKRKKGLGRLK